jgi:hypothetical protein
MVFQNTTRWKLLEHQQQKIAHSLRAAGTESKPPNTPNCPNKYNNKTTEISWIKLQYQNYNKGTTEDDDDDSYYCHHEIFLPLRKNWLQVWENTCKRTPNTTRKENKFCEKQCFFFYCRTFAIFRQTNWEKKMDSFFSSVNSANIANLIVKFRQNFDTKFSFKFFEKFGENTQHVCANSYVR